MQTFYCAEIQQLHEISVNFTTNRTLSRRNGPGTESNFDTLFFCTGMLAPTLLRRMGVDVGGRVTNKRSNNRTTAPRLVMSAAASEPRLWVCIALALALSAGGIPAPFAVALALSFGGMLKKGGQRQKPTANEKQPCNE